MFALALLAVLVPQSPSADSLRDLARRLSDASLAAEARAQPLAVRFAVLEAMERAVRAPRDAESELAFADRIAAAYAVAWRDSFFVREVRRFGAWPPNRRAAKAESERLRRSGVTAYEQEGPAAALPLWRRALGRARAAGDTAGMAALLGNIGSAHLAEGRLDSAEACLARARRLAALVGDARVEANAVGALAGVSEDRGELEAARRQYLEALGLRERTGDARGVAADYNNLGNLAQGLGDLGEARRQYGAALALNRRDGRDALAALNQINLAGVAVLDGEFAEAETQYRDALALLKSREMWPDVAAALLGLGQLQTRRGDYPAATQTLREAAALYDRTGPAAEALAARRALANVFAAAGRMQDALDEMRRLESQADGGRAPARARAGIALARADLAVQLNSLAEAEVFYARAEQLYRRGADPAGVAEAQQGRGLLFLARDDPGRAQVTLAAAMRTQLAAGNRRAAALTRLALAQVARERDDTATARRHLAAALFELERVRDPVAAAAVVAEQAALESGAGRALAAESLYRAALAKLQGRVAPDVAWQLHGGMAVALRAQRRLDGAARELRAALATAERPRRSLARPERRSAFFADKWDLYSQLAITEADRGRPGAAFDASERLRAREMLELLALGRVAAPGDTAGGLIAREQDLRRHIGELMDALGDEMASGGALRGPDISRASAVTRQALSQAQDEYADVLLEMQEAAPRYAAVVAPRAASWRDVAQRLSPREAFVEYLVSDSATLAFVIARDTIAVVDLGARRRDVARLVELARGTLSEPPTPGDSLWHGVLRRLHRQLFGPLEETGLLAGVTRLVLVPHAELHYLPFAALLGEEPGSYLITRYDLATTPSAAVWVALGDRTRPRRPSGGLALAPRADVLPASLDEIAVVARLSGARPVAGPRATEAGFRREAPGSRVLHLATYGVLNKQNPLFSFVDLAPGDGDDGRLEVHEVLGLDLSADLVVLSACQTGVGSGMRADVPAGDEWVSLTRAFLHAGAASVVATLWPVEDRATEALMERFYVAYQRRGDPVGALAEAQRALLSAGTSAHPFYWAGLVAVEGAGARAAEARLP